jgi:ABC-2 type transport system ATP-binding protein
MEPILSVRDLSKTIGRRTIVHDLDFDVLPREVFGFLGPNGAGKTTTIRMLVGLIRPTTGRITISGFDVQRQFESAMASIGCIVETPDLYRFMSGQENLEHFARMTGRLDRSEIDRVSELVHLRHRLREKVRTYSLGMRQRLGIAIALLGGPRLLILDEPANGLDPAGMREMRLLIRRLAEEEGVGVFLSSHLLSEVEQVCDRVAIIHHGRIIRIGPVRELVSEQHSMEIRVDQPERAASVAREEGFASRMIDHTLLLPISEEQSARLIARFTASGISVYSARPVLPTLEELFMEATAGETVE